MLKFSVLFALLLLFVFTHASAQTYGYQGKRTIINCGMEISSSPGQLNVSRYGKSRNFPSGFNIPLMPTLEFEYALFRQISVGLRGSFANNFVAYRLPWTIDGTLGAKVKLNDGSQELSIVDHNRYVRTASSTLFLNCFRKEYLAPLGSYFQYSVGKIFVGGIKGDYTYKTRETLIGRDTVYDKILHHDQAFVPLTRFGFAYHLRGAVKAEKRLFFDVGLQMDFVLSQQFNQGIYKFIGTGFSKVDFSEKNLDDLIQGNTYWYIAKQNLFKVNFCLVYVL